MSWKINTIEIIEEFLDGFSFLGNIGKIISWAIQEKNYIVTSVDTQNFVLENPEEGIIASLSPTQFVLQQIKNHDKHKLIKEFTDWQPLILGDVSPSSYEKIKFMKRSTMHVDSEEDVFRKICQIENPFFDKLSKNINIPKLMQDLDFRFKAGSTYVEIGIHGQCFGKKNQNFSAENFFVSPKQNEIIRRKMNKPEEIPGWAVILISSSYEIEPETPSQANNFLANNLKKLYDNIENILDLVKRDIR